MMSYEWTSGYRAGKRAAIAQACELIEEYYHYDVQRAAPLCAIIRALAKDDQGAGC